MRTSPGLRARMVEGPDSVVARWLRPPFDLDGWRIDVANMTGRYLDEDLNADVRRIIRRTMIETNPDTILLGESTNDATEDFQGDGWHGAMTYANFTRPVWGWLSRESGNPWFYGIPYGGIPSYTGDEFFVLDKGGVDTIGRHFTNHALMNGTDKKHFLCGVPCNAFGVGLFCHKGDALRRHSISGLSQASAKHGDAQLRCDDEVADKFSVAQCRHGKLSGLEARKVLTAIKSEAFSFKPNRPALVEAIFQQS